MRRGIRVIDTGCGWKLEGRVACVVPLCRSLMERYEATVGRQMCSYLLEVLDRYSKQRRAKS